jgi:hypothetical protein
MNVGSRLDAPSDARHAAKLGQSQSVEHPRSAVADFALQARNRSRPHAVVNTVATIAYVVSEFLEFPRKGGA